MSRPRPGVVVPCYRAAHVLEASLTAFRAQRAAAEWVFVDDGSDDATALVLERELARPFAAENALARVVRLPTNQGRAAARNAGVRALSGDADPLLFLDADVAPDPNLVGRLSRRLMREPEAVAVVARVRPVGGDPTDPYVRYLSSSMRGPARTSGPVPWKFFLTTSAVRRAAFESAGGFDPDVSYGEDLDLAARLALDAPDGLRADDGPPVDVHDPGTLDTALAKLTEFARDNLPGMLERHPHVSPWVHADRLERLPVRLALRFAPLAHRALPWLRGRASDAAVRLVLAAHFADALRAGRSSQPGTLR